MSDLPPPSSQQVHEPPFFHLPDGQRMQIFVEAGGILNRPRLIRKLKKHDAHICTDPKNAQVILVDANSWQGKEFIREWGQDQNKVVLNYAWVTASENAGRPLLADDNWGTCLTKDDGLPILKPTGMGDDREVGTAYAPFAVAVATELRLSQRSLLPTPRETPVETEFAQSKSVNASDIGSEKASSYKPLTQGSSTASPHVDSYERPAAHPLSQSQSHLLHHQQQPQSPSIPSPSPTDSTSMFPSNMPFGTPNGAMSPFNMPMNMIPLPNNMLSIFAQQQQQQQQQQQLGVSSPMIPQASPMMPNIPEHFTTALMDIMKMYSAVPGGTSTGQWPTFPGAVPQQSPQTLPPPTTGSSTSGTAVREGSSSASVGRRNTESPDLSIMSYRPPSSAKRKRRSNGSLHNSTDDDGEDEVPLAHMEKKKKASTSTPPSEREERTARRTVLSFSAPGRNPHSKSSASAPPSSGSLFVNQEGKPMQFYVQVDLKGRGEVLRAIKKNGGTLTADIGIADYAVLWSKSTTFKELLANAGATQTPAVTYHFVLDAASEGSIPENLENYLFDAIQDVKSKRSGQSLANAERRRIAKNAQQAEKRARERDLEYNFVARSKPLKIPTRSTSAIAAPSGKSVDRASKEVESSKCSAATPVKPRVATASKSTPASSSSPTKTVQKSPRYYPKEQTPPLPSGVERLKHGVYSYTSDERDWMEKYAFILFKRDPSMNRTDISNALHKKLPHHSTRSIAQILRSALDEQYNTAKKRGGIAHRKEKSQWEQEQLNEQKKREMEKDEKKGEQCQQHVEQAIKDVKVSEREEDIEDAMEIVREPHKEDNEGILPVPDPMDVDETIHPTTDGPSQAENNGASLTSVEEEDIKVFLRVFANGDDPEQSEEQFFEKLGKVATCKSAPTWREFNTRHEQQIMDRFSKQMDTTRRTEEQ